MARGKVMSQNMRVGSWVQAILFGMAIVLSVAHSTSAQQTELTPTKPVVTSTTQLPTVTGTAKQIAPIPPPPPLPAALRETPNNPLAPPQNMDDLLKLQMTTDIWAAMYSPLSCLDAFVTS